MPPLRRYVIEFARFGAVLLALGTGPAIAGQGVGTEFEFHHEDVMGTSLELRVLARDGRAASMAEGRVLAEIDRLSAIFSGYDPHSEFRLWQAGGRESVRISPELFEVLALCDSWRARSGGAFDPRVEVLSRLWATAERLGRLPSEVESREARRLMAVPAWRLEHGGPIAERMSRCPLSLNAIAKGYIVERACEAAFDRASGVQGLLLNVGGDMRVRGQMAPILGIVSPLADSETSEPIVRIRVHDRAVATSGRSQRGFRIGGRRYSHIFDPRTARPVETVAAATVVAPSSVDADALATILNILGPADGLRLAASVPGTECLIIADHGLLFRSPGWERFEEPEPAVPDPVPAVPARLIDDPVKSSISAPAPASWNREFELVVSFEINRQDAAGRRYRRPYVAVWVEDKDGIPVRNISLWVSLGGSGPFQWLPDMKRWYRGDQLRKDRDPAKRDMVFTMARPTRPPGKYSVIWDGKDDQGKPVGPGEYTILIDAAREHGTYQSIRKPVTLGDRPFLEELKGNVEIKSASIEYRRKGPAK